MIFYKEVHKYNGRYYSRYDNSYQFVIGEIAKPKEDDYIYGTDTIEEVLKYNYVPFDMAILELETVGKSKANISGHVVTAKKVKVLREVNYYERKDNSSTREVSTDRSNSVLFNLLQERRHSVLSEMRHEI